MAHGKLTRTATVAASLAAVLVAQAPPSMADHQLRSETRTIHDHAVTTPMAPAGDPASSSCTDMIDGTSAATRTFTVTNASSEVITFEDPGPSNGCLIQPAGGTKLALGQTMVIIVKREPRERHTWTLGFIGNMYEYAVSLTVDVFGGKSTKCTHNPGTECTPTAQYFTYTSEVILGRFES